MRIAPHFATQVNNAWKWSRFSGDPKSAAIDALAELGDIMGNAQEDIQKIEHFLNARMKSMGVKFDFIEGLIEGGEEVIKKTKEEREETDIERQEKIEKTERLLEERKSYLETLQIDANKIFEELDALSCFNLELRRISNSIGELIADIEQRIKPPSRGK